MQYLLDKNIMRFALEGLQFASYRPLRKFEQDSLAFIQRAYQSGDTLFISNNSFNIIKRWINYREVQQLRSVTQVLYPTRYHKRWSRRVREVSGLSREDSVLIALTTFGGTRDGELIGVDALITFDQPLINGFHQHQTLLAQRLNRMTPQLKEPFDKASLPEVYSPIDI